MGSVDPKARIHRKSHQYKALWPPDDVPMPRTQPDVEDPSLERRIQDVGEALGSSLSAVKAAIPGDPQGPQNLARALGLDKVLTSRLLKAIGKGDPMAVLHHVPGPEPLRRVLRAARKVGVPAATVQSAERSVEAFDQLIRQEAGDRSSLGAIISAWLPEAREEFELRRKQSAFKAMSQLKGAELDMDLSAAFLHPSKDGKRIDVVWANSAIGLKRLRPGAKFRFTSRRMVPDDATRRPTTLDGEPVEGLDRVRLDEFCIAPPAQMDVHQLGDVLHYTLGGDGYGPRSAVDVVFVEVNLEEIPRALPKHSKRKAYVYSEVWVPTKTLDLDLFVHEDLYRGADPELLIYDTAIHGLVDVNDPAREIDRLDMTESIQPLGKGTGRIRIAEVPRYADLVRLVFGKMGWEEERFRGYRVRVEYPIYGSQIVLAFDASSLQ